MPAKQNYFKLGLFVLASLLILGVLLFLLGGRSLFAPKVVVETYFNESVAGLEVGAPVKFRGVPFGQVSQIGVSTSFYQKDVPLDDARNYIVVRMTLTGFTEEEIEERAPVYVKRGLRASTQLAGVTGQLFISLDFAKGDALKELPFEWTPRYLYIPSTPSLTNQIITNAQSFLASLDDADIGELGQTLNRLAATLDKKASEVPLGELANEAIATLKSAQATLDRAERALAKGRLDEGLRNFRLATGRLDTILAAPAFESVPRDLAAVSERLQKLTASGEIDRLVASLDQAAARADRVIGNNEYDLRTSIEDLRTSLENVRALTDSAKRYPPGLFFSEPPKPIELPTEAR